MPGENGDRSPIRYFFWSGHWKHCIKFDIKSTYVATAALLPLYSRPQMNYIGHGGRSTFEAGLNQLHLTLKFTSEISSSQVTFLDLIMYKGERFKKEGKLGTRVATKKTDTFQYLAQDSAHPESVFGGLVKGEVTRYSRICTHFIDFEEKVNSLNLKGNSKNVAINPKI